MLRCLALFSLLSATPALAEAPRCRVATGKLSVQFKPEVSLQELATWVMSFSCKNIVFSTEVAKHATKLVVLAPAQPMTTKQAMQLFVDAVQSTGLVVKQKPGSIVISLGPKMPRGCPDLAAGSSGDSTVPVAAPTQGDPEADKLAELMDRGIKKVDDTHYDIEESLVEAVLLNPMPIVKGARVVPAMKDGKPTGIKLYAIRPSSLFARLGLANGDTVKALNGYELTSVDKGLEVYTTLRQAKKLELSLERRGKPLTLTYRIVK